MTAQVIIANRNNQRAEELAAAVGPEARAVGLAELGVRRPGLQDCCLTGSSTVKPSARMLSAGYTVLDPCSNLALRYDTCLLAHREEIVVTCDAWYHDALVCAHTETLRADVLANTTSVGMAPAVDETPIAAAALEGYWLVFDAVYTPLETRLLKVLIKRHVCRDQHLGYPNGSAACLCKSCITMSSGW